MSTKKHSAVMGCLLTMATLLAGAGYAADYYVAPGGDDANPGTIEKPMKSPVKAARMLKPGDTLYFRAGTYRCKTDGIVGLAPPCDGEKDKPITLRSYNNEHVRLDVSGTDWGLTNAGYSWIVFDGFEVFGSRNNNMKLASKRGGGGTGHHVTVRNCDFHGSGRENVFCHSTPYLLFENCRFHDSKRSHGLYLQVGCHNPVVRNCTSENNRGNSGIQFNATAEGGITNALVERCLLRGNAQGFSQMGVIDSVFRNNVVYNDGVDGPRGSGWRELIMWTYGKNGTKCRGNLWENNTFVNTLPPGHKLNTIVRSKSGTSDITFRNNIFVVRGKPLFMLESFDGFVFENNCLYNIGGGGQVQGAGKLEAFAAAKGLKASGNVTGDPMFVDIDKGDLRLTEKSPCLNAGAKTAGGGQIEGKAPDMGAFEHGAAVRVGCKLPWMQ